MIATLRAWFERKKLAASPFPRLVGVGHSHLVALQEAVVARDASTPGRYEPARFLQMMAPDYSPSIAPDGSLNPALARAIEAAQGDGPPPLLFDCVSGNEYHFIGLVNHPRRYDFVLPSQPDLPLQPNVEIIPAPLMRDVIEARVAHAVACLKALREQVEGPLWHIQSPPPIRSDDHLRAYPSHFAEMMQAHGVADATFRLKLWLLQSEVYRSWCDRLGVGFVPVPSTACDADGFLLEAGWPPDPAHANAWYGGHVLDQLDVLHRSHQTSNAA